MPGWVKIRGNNDIRAAREAKVPTDGLTHGDTMWVPMWVRDAIQLYKKNENFAEMPLSEFLSRMNPEAK